MKISFALSGLVAANPATYNNNGMNNNYNQASTATTANNYNQANNNMQANNYNQANNNMQSNNYNQANNNMQANNAYPSQPGTYGATSYGSTGYGKGLSCWTCDAYSFDDCHKKGKLRKCNANEGSCFLEIRERRNNGYNGNFKYVCMGCKATDACQNLKAQNFQSSDPSKTQCRPESNFTSSVCRQCCTTNNCTKAPVWWHPKNRTEWGLKTGGSYGSSSNYGSQTSGNQYNAGMQTTGNQYNAGSQNSGNQYNAGMQNTGNQYNAGSNNNNNKNKY